MTVPLPGADLSNTNDDRDFHDRMVHNFVLTVFIDNQKTQEGYFQSLLGGPRVMQWPRILLLDQRELELLEAQDEDSTPLATTAPLTTSTAHQGRKKKPAPKGVRAIKDKIESQGKKRKRNVGPDLSAFATDLRFSQDEMLPASQPDSKQSTESSDEESEFEDTGSAAGSDSDSDKSPSRKKRLVPGKSKGKRSSASQK